MRVSAQEEYGLRCLITLARKNGEMTISQMSKVEDMTESHVAKTLAALRRAGFVVSTRGKSGGYRLSRRPEEITVASVMHDLGGRLHERDYCSRFGNEDRNCPHQSRCHLNLFWVELQALVDSYANRVTLAELAYGRSDQPSSTQQVQSRATGR